MSASIDALVDSLEGEAPAGHRRLYRFGDCTIAVRSNAVELLVWLDDYYAAFDSFVADSGGAADFSVRAYQMEAPDFGLAYRTWTREPGKALGKEAFVDLEDGRAVRKVRTGMQFLIGGSARVAVGDCLGNANQIVNFINFQYTAWQINRGRVLCHAAGITREGQGVAMASMSGGGKSTLTLRMLGEGFDFVSNDRLLIERGPEGGHRMWGVPKHPRINPGTILADPNLGGLIDEPRRRALQAMPRKELWSLEEKYDARIDEIYGPARVRPEGEVKALLVLGWSPTSEEVTRFSRVSPGDDAEVLDAIMKSPGPFFLPVAGPPARGHEPPAPGPYLDALAGLDTLVARGAVDFDQAAGLIRELMT